MVKMGGLGTFLSGSPHFQAEPAALPLIYTGVLDECPGLTVVHPHLGGVLPYLRDRFEVTHRMHLPDPRPLEDYLQTNFFTDTCNTTAGALDMAAAMIGRDRILFATDYPWQPRSMVVEMLAEHSDRDLVHAICETQLPGISLPTR